MKNLFALITAFVIYSCVFGQFHKEIDSLSQLVNTASPEDKTKLYLQLSEKYSAFNLDSSVLYSDLCIENALKTKQDEERIIAAFRKAYILQIKGDTIKPKKMFKELYVQALELKTANSLIIGNKFMGGHYYLKREYLKANEYFAKSLEFAREYNDTIQELKSLNNLGTILYGLGESYEALKYYLDALDLMELNSDEESKATLLVNIGTLYLSENKIQNGLSFFKKAQKISEKLNLDDVLVLVYNNMGTSYRNMEVPDSAMLFFKKAYNIFNRMGNASGEAVALGNIGNIYGKLNQTDSAYHYLYRSLELSREIGDNKYLVTTISYLTQLMLDDNNISLLKSYVEEGLELSHKYDFKKLKLSLLRIQAEYYERNKEYKKALNASQKYNSLYVEIFDTEKDELVTKLEAKFSFESQEKENQLLRTQNDLKQLQIEQQTKNFNIILIVLVGFVILSFIIVFLFVQKNRYAKSLRELNRELEKSNKTKDNFLSVLSHDLRSPFNSILGFSKILDAKIAQNVDPSDLAYYNSMVLDSANISLNLLDELLVWAKLQMGKFNLDVQQHNLNLLVDKNLAFFNTQLKQKEIELICPEVPNVDIKIDANVFNLLLRNLLSNSIKFSSKNSRIDIGIKTKLDNIEFEIRDYGTGIKEEHKNCLFSMEDSHSTLGTAGEKGTGLGLILCKEFVELHGGSLDFHSEYGRGSVFSFNIPV